MLDILTWTEAKPGEGEREENETEQGLRVYDPSYLNTAVVRSQITYIDGERGILRCPSADRRVADRTDRGYPIEQLAEHSTFLETAYLILYGELPTRAQFEFFSAEVMHHSALHTNGASSMLAAADTPSRAPPRPVQRLGAPDERLELGLRRAQRLCARGESGAARSDALLAGLELAAGHALALDDGQADLPAHRQGHQPGRGELPRAPGPPAQQAAAWPLLCVARSPCLRSSSLAPRSLG